MKTLKVITVLILTAALFFSCTENSDYGTLIINPFGGGSSRTVNAEVGTGFYEGFENGLTYSFTCINQNDNSTVESGTYDLGKNKANVQIQLHSGNWDVWVKLNKNGKVIGSNKYPTVTIKAGETIALGSLVVEIQGYSYGSAVAHKAPENFDYAVDSPYWDDTPPLKINRHLITDDGVPDHTTPDNYYIYAPEGTAKVLWDERNIYILVNVYNADLTGYTGGTNDKGKYEHDSDSVEIFLTETGATGHQYRIAIVNGNLDTEKTYGYSPLDGKHYKDTDALNFPANFPKPVSFQIITDGLPSNSYAVVAKIPFPTSGGKIGIDFQINGAPKQQGENRNSVTVWYYKKGQVYDKPSKYKDTLILTN